VAAADDAKPEIQMQSTTIQNDGGLATDGRALLIIGIHSRGAATTSQSHHRGTTDRGRHQIE